MESREGRRKTLESNYRHAQGEHNKWSVSIEAEIGMGYLRKLLTRRIRVGYIA
jgi:hypothetical protein